MTELVAAGHGFQKWLSSKSSTALLDVWNDTMLGSVASREQYEACCKQLFGPYCPQPDVAGWLLGVAVLAESLPLSLTVSDCMIAGQPLVYVNAKFTEVTGYTKIDCAGRNCRFLQGPGTNPDARPAPPRHAAQRRGLTDAAAQLPQERRTVRELADDALRLR